VNIITQCNIEITSAVIVKIPPSLPERYAVSTCTVTAVSWDRSAVNFRVKFLRTLHNLNKNNISPVQILLVYSFIHLFIYSFIRLFVYSFIHLFIYSFMHLFIYSFIYKNTAAYSGNMQAIIRLQSKLLCFSKHIK